VYPYYHGFEPYSYDVMLMGLGRRPVQPRPALGLIDGTGARREFESVRRESAGFVETLPSHYDYLALMR
jgi:tryptophan halogenase